MTSGDPATRLWRATGRQPVMFVVLYLALSGIIVFGTALLVDTVVRIIAAE